MEPIICESNWTNSELISISNLNNFGKNFKIKNFLTFHKSSPFKFKNYKIFRIIRIYSLTVIKGALKKRGYRCLKKIFQNLTKFFSQKFYFRRLKKSHFIFLYFFYSLKVFFEQKTQSNLNFFSRKLDQTNEKYFCGKYLKKIYFSISSNSFIFFYFYVLLNLLAKNKNLYQALVFSDFFFSKIEKIIQKNICFKNNHIISRFLNIKVETIKNNKSFLKNYFNLTQNGRKTIGYKKNKILDILSNSFPFKYFPDKILIRNQISRKIIFQEYEITFLFLFYYFSLFFYIFSGKLLKFIEHQKNMILIIKLKKYYNLEKTRRSAFKTKKKKDFYKKKQFFNLNSGIQTIYRVSNRKITILNFDIVEYLGTKIAIKNFKKKQTCGILLIFFFYSKFNTSFLQTCFFNIFCSLHFFFHRDLMKIFYLAFPVDNCFLFLFNIYKKSICHFFKKKKIIKNKFGNKVFDRFFFYNFGKKFYTLWKNKKKFFIALNYFPKFSDKELKNWPIISFLENFTQKEELICIYKIFKPIFFRVICKKIKNKQERISFSFERNKKISESVHKLLFLPIKDRLVFINMQIVFYRKRRNLKKNLNTQSFSPNFFLFSPKFSIRQKLANLNCKNLKNVNLEKRKTLKIRNNFLFYNFIHSKNKKNFPNLKMFLHNLDLVLSIKNIHFFTFLLEKVGIWNFLSKNRNKNFSKDLIKKKRKKYLDNEARFFFGSFFIKQKI